jgi:hypothetical protein
VSHRTGATLCHCYHEIRNIDSVQINSMKTLFDGRHSRCYKSRSIPLALSASNTTETIIYVECEIFDWASQTSRSTAPSDAQQMRLDIESSARPYGGILRSKWITLDLVVGASKFRVAVWLCRDELSIPQRP